MNRDHTATVVPITDWAVWQTKCVCGWVSEYQHNRPAAVREHTIHAMRYLAGA